HRVGVQEHQYVALGGACTDVACRGWAAASTAQDAYVMALRNRTRSIARTVVDDDQLSSRPRHVLDRQRVQARAKRRLCIASGNNPAHPDHRGMPTLPPTSSASSASCSTCSVTAAASAVTGATPAEPSANAIPASSVPTRAGGAGKIPTA